MDGILRRAVDRTLHIIDAVDDLITEAAAGFAAACPVIIALNGDAQSELVSTEH